MWWAVLAFGVLLVWLQPLAGTNTALLVAGLGAVAVWLIDIQIHPWTRCLRCRGKPRRYDAAGTSWGDCRWCEGSGRRRRLFAKEKP